MESAASLLSQETAQTYAQFIERLHGLGFDRIGVQSGPQAVEYWTFAGKSEYLKFTQLATDAPVDQLAVLRASRILGLVGTQQFWSVPVMPSASPRDPLIANPVITEEDSVAIHAILNERAISVRTIGMLDQMYPDWRLHANEPEALLAIEQWIRATKRMESVMQTSGAQSQSS